MTEHPYELLVNSLLALHLLGFGTIFGYAVTQIPNFKTGAKVQPGLIHGTWLSLVTALAMVGVAPMNNDQLNYMSVSLKSIVITAIFFIAYTFNKKETTPKWVVPTIGLLTVINLCVAVLLGMTVDA